MWYTFCHCYYCDCLNSLVKTKANICFIGSLHIHFCYIFKISKNWQCRSNQNSFSVSVFHKSICNNSVAATTVHNCHLIKAKANAHLIRSLLKGCYASKYFKNLHLWNQSALIFNVNCFLCPFAATIMEKIFHVKHILSLPLQMIPHTLVKAKADTCLIGSLCKGYYIKKFKKRTSTEPIRIDLECQYIHLSICNSYDRNIFHLIHIMLLLILLILHCLVEAKADTCVIGSLCKGYYIEKYIKLTFPDPIRIDFQC